MNVLFVGSSSTLYGRGWSTSNVRRALGAMGIGSRQVFANSAAQVEAELAGPSGTIVWPIAYNLAEGVSLHSTIAAVGAPFVGSGYQVCRYHSKLAFKGALTSNGIPTPAYQTIKNSGDLDNDLGYPVMLKSDASCNSWGVVAVNNAGELRAEVDSFRGSEVRLFLEEWRRVTEYTVAYLPPSEGERAIFAPIQLDIVDGRFTYIDARMKMNDDALIFRTPDDDVCRRLVQLALEIVGCLGVDGHCRIDFVQDQNGRIYATDLNLLPFMNWTLRERSYYPRALHAHGVAEYEVVLRKLLWLAMARHKHSRRG